MRSSLRMLFLISLCFLVAACSCRTRKVGPSDNIPMAEEGSDLKDINFAFDRFDLSVTAQSILKRNAGWLQENDASKIEIEGHCDARGTNEYNMALGAKRARAAQEFLRSLGVADSRMSTVSYGEELPLDPRSNEEAWSKNRRAHFRIIE